MHKTSKSRGWTILLSLLATACVCQSLEAQRGKKGFPLATDGTDSSSISLQKLQNINASWYYNYGYESNLFDNNSQRTIQFVPMVLYPDSISAHNEQPKSPLPDHVLGYNEPDHASGSGGCTNSGTLGHDYVDFPSHGAQLWPTVISFASAGSAIGPASSYMGSGHPECYPWTSGSWFKTFHDDLSTQTPVTAHPHDIALHIYTCNIDIFTQYMEAAHSAYPDNNFWVTEFACETESSAQGNVSHPTRAQVYNFMQAAISFMEDSAHSWISRYSWHDSGQGTSKIFQNDGTADVTCVGQKYANPSATPSGTCAP